MEDKVERHIFQFVEGELYKYKINKQIIEEYNKELLCVGVKSGLAKYPTGRFPQNRTADSTGQEAMRVLRLEEKASRAMWYVRAIEDVLELLSEQERELVKLKYFIGWLTDVGICGEMHIGRSTYYERKAKILSMFAHRMGLF